MNENLNILQQSLNYNFSDLRLLQVAITHKSYLNEKDRQFKELDEHNERLEFLGDAVLELVVTEYLYANFNDPEGYLTALRASVVNYRLIGEVGQELGLEDLIFLSKGEKEELGKARLTIVADCMEAIIGAMYLDGGYQPCVSLIKEKILIKLSEIIAAQRYKDSKTRLQEYVQKHLKITPKYKIISSEGKDHEKVFQAGVVIESELVSTGEGKSKQDAEIQAASLALEVIVQKVGIKED